MQEWGSPRRCGNATLVRYLHYVHYVLIGLCALIGLLLRSFVAAYSGRGRYWAWRQDVPVRPWYRPRWYCWRQAATCRGSRPARRRAPSQITVAVVPGFENAPLQVAVKDGLFTQHGLNVTVQTYQTLQQAYGALASGQADVISGDYAGLLYMQARAPRAQLRLIADGYDATPGLMEVLTLPGSAITAPQDLEGKAVATPLPELAPFSADAPYNVETLAAEAVLQSDGVSPSSVLWKAMAPGSMISALRDHTVSAIVATEPYILQAETELGAVELFDACSGVTAEPAAVRVLHHGRLRARSCGSPAWFPGRAQRGEGQHGPARRRPVRPANAAGDVRARSRPCHDRPVPHVPEYRAGPAGGRPHVRHRDDQHHDLGEEPDVPLSHRAQLNCRGCGPWPRRRSSGRDRWLMS